MTAKTGSIPTEQEHYAVMRAQLPTEMWLHVLTYLTIDGILVMWKVGFADVAKSELVRRAAHYGHIYLPKPEPPLPIMRPQYVVQPTPKYERNRQREWRAQRQRDLLKWQQDCLRVEALFSKGIITNDIIRLMMSKQELADWHRLKRGVTMDIMKPLGNRQ